MFTMLTKIAEFREANADAEIGSIHTELIPMGKPVGHPMVPRDGWDLPLEWRAKPKTEPD